MSGEISLDCINQVEALLLTIPQLQKRAFHIYSEAELLDDTKGLQYPCAGVVYNGIRAIPEAKPSGKQGIAAELVATIMVFYRQNNLVKTKTEDPKVLTLGIMDSIRNNMMHTRSPSGHFWKFQLESAVDTKVGVLTYIQRWSTPVMLASS